MTKEEANALYDLHLQGGRRNTSIAEQICKAWNQGDLKVNWLGGTGYHVKDGRIAHNDYRLKKPIP